MKAKARNDYMFEDTRNSRIFEQKIATGFIDNQSIQTRRELTDVEPFISLKARPGRKVVEHPTDITRKLAKANAFLASRGITEPRSTRALFFGDPDAHKDRMRFLYPVLELTHMKEEVK